MNGYLLELAGVALAALLLGPAATTPVQSAADTPAASEQQSTDWADCLACHPDHASTLPRLSELRPAGLGSTLRTSCATCHEQAELARFPSSWNHPIRPVGAHVSCLACHRVEPHSTGQPPAKPQGDYDAQGCFTCHAQAKLDFGVSRGHDNHPAIRCLDCHPPHEPLRAGLPAELLPAGTRSLWQRSYDWHTSNEQCLRCHPAGGLFFFTNQGGFVTLNTTNYHELHVESGQALCIECHNPHGGPNPAFIRNTLLTGEILSYSQSYNGGTCAVNCHGVQHDYWQYINSVR